MNTTLDTLQPVPVYDLSEVVALAAQHEAHIQSIKDEVCSEYDNISTPVPFIVAAA